MRTDDKIHLVHAAAPAIPLTRRDLDPREIVRETLAIMHECSQAFASDELLVDLVASLIVVRLQKGRTR